MTHTPLVKAEDENSDIACCGNGQELTGEEDDMFKLGRLRNFFLFHRQSETPRVFPHSHPCFRLILRTTGSEMHGVHPLDASQKRRVQPRGQGTGTTRKEDTTERNLPSYFASLCPRSTRSQPSSTAATSTAPRSARPVP